MENRIVVSVGQQQRLKHAQQQRLSFCLQVMTKDKAKSELAFRPLVDGLQYILYTLFCIREKTDVANEQIDAISGHGIQGHVHLAEKLRVRLVLLFRLVDLRLCLTYLC